MPSLFTMKAGDPSIWTPWSAMDALSRSSISVRQNSCRLGPAPSRLRNKLVLSRGY